MWMYVSLKEILDAGIPNKQLFWDRLPHQLKSYKRTSQYPKGLWVMAIDWNFRCLSVIEENNTKTCVHASLHSYPRYQSVLSGVLLPFSRTIFVETILSQNREKLCYTVVLYNKQKNCRSWLSDIKLLNYCSIIAFVYSFSRLEKEFIPFLARSLAERLDDAISFVIFKWKLIWDTIC